MAFNANDTSFDGKPETEFLTLNGSSQSPTSSRHITTETYPGSGTGSGFTNQTWLAGNAGTDLGTGFSNRTWLPENATGLVNQTIYLNPSANESVYFHGTLNSSVHWCENASALPHDEQFDEFYETAQFITGLILYPCICVPGLMGNFLTLLVMSNRNMRTSTNAFLSALAVADSIKLINDLLYFCTILLLRTDDVVGNRAYGYLYPYAHFIFSMSVCVSSWLTVSVAVERYIMVCHPTRARDVCNRNRAVAVCAAVFLVMTTLALPSALR